MTAAFKPFKSCEIVKNRLFCKIILPIGLLLWLSFELIMYSNWQCRDNGYSDWPAANTHHNKMITNSAKQLTLKVWKQIGKEREILSSMTMTILTAAFCGRTWSTKNSRAIKQLTIQWITGLMQFATACEPVNISLERFQLANEVKKRRNSKKMFSYVFYS